MKRMASLSPVLLVAALWPAFLQTSVTCDLSHNPNLRSLEVEAGGVDRIVGFKPGTTHYDVWVAGAASFTVRAKAIEGVTTISWGYGDESGVLGVSDGEVTLAVIPGASLLVSTSAPRGAAQTYTIAIDPVCSPGSCDDANRCTTDVCNPTSQTCEFWEESTCPLQGRLRGGPFSGVSWESLGTSARRTGVLDESSTFDYLPDHDVRFFIGETVFGEVAGAEEIDWFDIVGLEPVIGMTDVSAMLGERDSRLHTMINIAVFLYTLDHDGDASNGVEISDDTAYWFDFLSVQFERDWVRFRHDPALRVALSQLNALDVLPEHRPVRNSAYAIQSLYESLGVDARIFGPQRFEYTEGPTNPAYAEEFLYDEWGNRYFRRWRYPANRLYWAIHGGVDDNGNKTTWWDGPYPGIPDLTRHEYDDDHNLIRKALDLNANAIIDSYTHYEYDAYGRRVLEDGSDQITWDYDEDGNQIRQYEGASITHMEHDPRGYLTRASEDDDGNGTIEREWLYEYDAEGHQVAVRHYDPPSVLVDETRFDHTYDVDGNLTQWTAVRNAVHVETRSWAYDVDGNATTMASTVGSDMSPGRGFTATYVPTGWAAALDALPRVGAGSWPPQAIDP
jgi:hypothetical protein